jgi:hypothetical protein
VSPSPYEFFSSAENKQEEEEEAGKAMELRACAGRLRNWNIKRNNARRSFCSLARSLARIWSEREPEVCE